MHRLPLKKKGMVLLMVLSLLVVVVILANIILAIISSQSRLTNHQVSRIQAYYATQAAMNLAFEQLRSGAWGNGTFALCPAVTGCPVVGPNAIIDNNIPFPVTITINLPALNITSNYTYTP